jgi:hypothetical protein
MIRHWVLLELRRRARPLVVLALLVALSAGVVLTAVAGARRADSALDRLLERTSPATVAVLPNEPGFDWDAVRALPGVEALAEFPISGYRIDGVPDEDFAGLFPLDGVALRDLERPAVLQGRLADPSRADEAVVTPDFAAHYGVGVGDTVTVRLYAPTTVDSQQSAPTPPEADGPVIDTRVVGIVQSFWFVFFPVDHGLFVPSAALFAQYRANLVGTAGLTSVNALVRLADGAAGLPAFRDGLAAVSGRADIEMFDLTEEAAKVARRASFEAVSLLAFGLSALAAAVVLVGQACARYVASAVVELQVLRALGMGRRQALGAAVAAPALAAVLGVAGGVALAVAGSAWFPIGTADRIEPSPGPAVDPLVLGLGGALLALVAVGGTAAAAWLALASRPGHGTPRSSVVARTATRLGMPVPVVVGLRFALEPGRGHSALPVRPALVGAVTGVLGVLAALTFSAGVSEAADNPARFGQTHQLEAFVGSEGTDFTPVGPLLDALIADPGVAGTLDVRHGVVEAAGRVPVTVFTHAPRGEDPFPVVLAQGRMAEEIVLAPRTAAALDVTVGDPLPSRGSGGSATQVVTGIGFVPYAGHNNYDDGAWVSPAGFERMVEGFKGRAVLVALRPGAEPQAALDRLSGSVGDALGLDPAAVPLGLVEPLVESAQLRNVEILPLALGGFLALLAVGAVGHALATAVRRRRHDLAVLRALGMTRRQARGVVVTQATVLAAVGLVLGVPLGLAVGRVLWRTVADITPLQYEAPVALLAVLLVAPVVVLVANTLAAWPGRQAARLRIAHVLRAG